MESLDRRTFIKTTVGLAGAYILGGCGEQQRLEQAHSQLVIPSLEETMVINEAATANQPAVRGEMTQVGPVPVPPKNWLEGELYTHILTNIQINSYTFDDGPSPYNTENVLRVLAQFGIKATFFVVGVNVRAWPEILQRIVDEGHEIGNHSVYHDPYQASALAGQIGPNQQIIHDTVGIYPVANRAPGLTKGQAILDTCRAHGMYELHTNMDTNDWRGNPRLTVGQLQAEHSRVYQNGSPWLYHDGGSARPTPSALQGMIEFDLSKGALLVPSTELLNSGVPVPGRNSFSAISANNMAESIDAYQNSSGEILVGTTCNYEPRQELLARLSDVSLKGAERSRIVEVLLDMEQYEKDHK